MSASIGSVLLMLGMAVAFGAQIGICMHAFAGNPGLGVRCLIVPFYAYVYARRHPVSVWLLRAWYAGMVCFAIGAIIASA